jgi:hypothetical protein
MKARIGWAAALTLTASAAQAVTPCDRLVAYARGLPPTAWAAGDAALAPALVFEPDRLADPGGRAPNGQERRVAALPEIRDALGVGDDGSLRVEHLAGTDLYVVTSIEGTLDCYNSVFVRTRTERETTMVPGPKVLSAEDNQACGGTVEGLGRAFDTHVHVIHDLVGPTTSTANFTLTPWEGANWGSACRAALTFRATYVLTDRYCGDSSVCEAAGKAAKDIAIAYNHLRETSSAADSFGAGPTPPADFAARLAEVKLSPAGGDFPTFGAAVGNEPGYGGAGHILFPLQLGDRWYAAAVGHGASAGGRTTRRCSLSSISRTRR